MPAEIHKLFPRTECIAQCLMRQVLSSILMGKDGLVEAAKQWSGPWSRETLECTTTDRAHCRSPFNKRNINAVRRRVWVLNE